MGVFVGSSKNSSIRSRMILLRMGRVTLLHYTKCRKQSTCYKTLPAAHGLSNNDVIHLKRKFNVSFGVMVSYESVKYINTR